MKTPEEILYNRLVTQTDGFHDHDSYTEQMREGYGDQIKEAMKAYAIEVLREAAERATVQEIGGIDSDGQSVDYYIVDKQSILSLIEEIKKP
jgi:sugar (pentulose or hexulose) kinase